MKDFYHYIQLAEQQLLELTGPSSFQDLRNLFQEFEEKLATNSLYTARNTAIFILDDLLRSNDAFQLLGSGSFAVAFQPINRSYVVKVWVADPAYDFVAGLIRANQNKPGIYLPRLKFSARTLFTAASGDRIRFMVMEPLRVINERVYKEYCMPIYKILHDQETYKLPDLQDFKHKVAAKMEDKIFGNKHAQRQVLEFIEQIYPTLELFRPSGFDWDLHRGNFMQRADGTIVITDPLVGD